MSYADKGALEAVAVVFAILPMVAVGLRFYARSLSNAKLGIDDWLMIPALILCVALGIVQIIGAQIGEIGAHQTKGPQGQLVLNQGLINYEKCKYALQLLATITLAFTKTSVIFLYRRIFSVRSFRLVTNVAIAITTAWGISFGLVTAFQCTPVSTIWTQFEMNYEPYCINQQAFYMATAVTDVVIDLFIFSMPIPMVLKLHLPIRQRIAVAGMFLLGGIVCAAGIVRLAIFAQTRDFTLAQIMAYFTDITYYTAPTFFWSLIECSVAVVGACLPTLRPLLMTRRPKSAKVISDYSRGSNSRKSRPTIMDTTADDRSSTASIAGLQKGKARTGVTECQTHVESLPLQDMAPQEGIRVQREFYGGSANPV